MQDIQVQAMETYKKNLQFLQSNNEALYKKINLLDALIANGSYQEKYSLEYKDEGYFDVKELSSEVYLYQTNSIHHAQHMTDMIDTKRIGAVFKALQYVRASDAQAEAIDKKELAFHSNLWATIKIINYSIKYAKPESYMQEVKKIIFLGIGLGLHLENIIEKLHAQVLFIKEKNIEIFRLSLFITDYAKLAQNRFIYFSITDDAVEEKNFFIEFLDKGNNYNLHMKHSPFFDNYELELQRLQSHVLSQSYINYGYSAILLRYINSPKYLAQGYSFLNINTLYENTIFAQKPILLLFSGPSTSNNIEWVKENHERFIIISPLSTCKLLDKNNISPDIVMHIDPGEETALLFEGLDTKEYFKNTQVILASNVNENTVNRFERSNIYFIEQGTMYKKGFGRLSAPSVGEYSYALFLIFGALNIYMLGIDLALDQKTLMSHADFHFGQTQGKVDNKSTILNTTSSIEYIKGNLIEKVPSTPVYKISIEQFEIFTDALKKEKHNIYNLSDGAYLKGSEPLHFEERDWTLLPKLNKQEIFDKLGEFLKSIDSTEFREEDKAILKYQIKEAKKLKKTIQQHQKKKYANVQAYLNTLSQLSWDLGDMEYKTHSDLAQVYYEYFPIILSYIFDLFNTQGLENPPQRVIEVDKILVQQLLKMVNLYITKMESYFKI